MSAQTNAQSLQSRTMSDPILMTRQATVRQNIDCAVHLLLDAEAFSSANLLAWAAIDVLRDVAKHREIRTSLDLIDEHIRSGKHREWYLHLKEHYNFAKHANKDPDKALVFNHDLVETAVFLAACDYQVLYGTLTFPMAMMQHWVLLRRPEFIDEGFRAETSVAKRLFGDTIDTRRLKEIYHTYQNNKAELEQMAQNVEGGLEVLEPVQGY